MARRDGARPVVFEGKRETSPRGLGCISVLAFLAWCFEFPPTVSSQFHSVDHFPSSSIPPGPRGFLTLSGLQER
ncbi:uncharacterized protein BDV14DRAFT_46919 [Aspergillus stella-maris]|uniref:uncharacterized protein n=1 Tax=Aspergillus stella-maris TaxID=1810926 RepID=UPI003CCE4BA6